MRYGDIYGRMISAPTTRNHGGCGEIPRALGKRPYKKETMAVVTDWRGRTLCAPTIQIRSQSGHHNYALRITHYELCIKRTANGCPYGIT